MKKLFTFLTLLLCVCSGARADKIGFTSSKNNNNEVAAPTMTTQNYVTVSVARGSQSTGSNKGNMYWGSKTALTFKGTCERTQYNSAGITAFNDNVWTGASFAITSGYKFTVTDIQVDIAGQDYEWGYKLDIVNGDGSVTHVQTATTAKTKADSKVQITKSNQSIVLTGTSYVKLYWYLKENTSTSKYLAIPELYLTGTVEQNVQTKYTKPTITEGAYSQPNGTYAVTLGVQNEEDGTINYTVGDAAEVTGAASGTIINVAPNTQITAYVTGDTYSNSDNATKTTSSQPKLSTPNYAIGSYDLMKNLYSVTLSAYAGDISYKIGSGSATAYSSALQLAPGTSVTAYATQTNMTQSDNLEFSVPSAPTGGNASSPTDAGTYTTNVSYNLGAITIPGACIAGQISSGTTPINGSIKTRCNQGLSDSNTGFYVNVNPGYTVTSISIEGCSNQTDANTCNAVYVDGVAKTGFTSVSLPLAAKDGSTGTIEVTDINATNKIEFAFENNYQGQMNITVNYTVSASSTLSGVSGFSKAFATFCAPNNFTITGATAYKAKVSGDNIVMTALEGVIPSGTGVVIAGDDAASYTLTYVSTDATADVTENDLHGVNVRTESATLKGNSSKLLALNSTEAEFQEYTGTYFPANKAYLLVPSTSRMKMVFADANEVTGIKSVTNNEKSSKARKFLRSGKLVIETAKGTYTVEGTQIQ